VTGDRAWAALRGGFAGLALFAAVVNALLLAGGEVSRWWLPVCVIGGSVVATWVGRRRAIGGGERAPRWLLWTAVVVVAVCTLALCYGATTTPARSWDGVVAWEIKGLAVTAQPTLQQPYFSDPAVWHHSASYPLLQPLCLASLGQWFGSAPARLLFPALYLVFVLTGGMAVWRATNDGRRGCWTTLALATTPFFVNNSGGAADSGYAEMFFALALCGVAAGLLTRDVLLLAAATFLLPWIKPEGTVVVLLVPAVCFLMSERRLLWGGVAAAAAGLALWLPLSVQLGQHRAAGIVLPLVILSTGLVLAAGRELLDRNGARVRGRLIAGVAIGGVGLACLLLAAPALERSGSAFAQFLDGFERVGDKVAHLPSILWGLVSHALQPRRFGLTFVLLVLVLFAWARRRSAPEHAASLVVLLGLGLATVLAAFLLAPEPDVQHHLRSSAPRLLSHWVGVVWVLVGGLWVRTVPGQKTTYWPGTGQ